MSIPEIQAQIWEWLEAKKRHVVLGTLFFLVSSISFALGYLASGELKHPQIVIEKSEAAVIETVKKEPALVKKKPAIVPAAPPPTPSPVTIVYEPPPVVSQPPSTFREAPGSWPPENVTGPAAPVTQPSPPPTPVQSPQSVPPPTPPVTISPPPPAPSPVSAPISSITITEVTAGTETSSDDEFIELYNPNSVAVDLTDYSIKKRTSGGSESTLVSATRLQGKSIPPGKHFLITHDEGYVGSVPADATWAKSNSLAYSNNAVVLYNGAGAKVAEVSWTELQKGMSTTGVPTPQNSSQ